MPVEVPCVDPWFGIGISLTYELYVKGELSFRIAMSFPVWTLKYLGWTITCETRRVCAYGPGFEWEVCPARTKYEPGFLSLKQCAAVRIVEGPIIEPPHHLPLFLNTWTWYGNSPT